MRALVSLALVLVAGCADDKYARPATWEEAAVAAPPTAAPPANPEAQKAKHTAKDVAESSSDAHACADRARTVFLKDQPAGLSVLSECAHRRDFTDLEVLLRGPWAADLKRSEELQLLLAEVIARRGGYVEHDAKMCQGAGVPVYALSSLLGTPEKNVGKLVLVRGSVVEVKREKWGKGTSQVATIKESSWAGDDESFDPASAELVDDTGRRIYARVDKSDARFNTHETLVFAMRFESARSFRDDEGNEGSTGIGVTVGVFDAAQRLKVY